MTRGAPLTGAVFAHSEGEGPVDRTRICVGQPYSTTGLSLAAGNLDGRGTKDLLIGAPGSDAGKKDGGCVFVIWDAGQYLPGRKTRGTSAPLRALLTGCQSYATLGESIAVADVDGDRLDDVIAGAPKHSFIGRNDCGAIAILPGAKVRRSREP